MSQGRGVLTKFLQHLVVQCIHDQMAWTTALLTKMCYCSQNFGILISTSLTKGNISKPILLLFVILCIYNFTSYMSKKYMTDSFLLSNLLAYLAATQYPLSIFFSSFLYYIQWLLLLEVTWRLMCSALLYYIPPSLRFDTHWKIFKEFIKSKYFSSLGFVGLEVKRIKVKSKKSLIFLLS